MGGASQWISKGVQSFGVTAGAVSRNRGIRKAADRLNTGSLESDAILSQYGNQQADIYRPYQEFGVSALDQLKSAAMQPQQKFQYRDSSQFLNEYFNSPEYATLNNQATDQILRGRSATGGLRSGGANVGLAQIAPTIGINALNRINSQDEAQYQINQAANAQRFGNLLAASNLGFSGANAAANTAGNLGTSLAAGTMFRAGNKADRDKQYYGNLGQMHEDLGAIWGN